MSKTDPKVVLNIRCNKALQQRFIERVPPETTQSEYLEWLLDHDNDGNPVMLGQIVGYLTVKKKP